MRIRHIVYRVQLVSEIIDGKAVIDMVELEDKGIDESRDIEVDNDKDLELLAKEIQRDNAAHEKMMCKIKKVGDTFNLTVKIITE